MDRHDHVFSAVFFFAVHLELGLSFVLALVFGLFGALRIVLKIRR